MSIVKDKELVTYEGVKYEVTLLGTSRAIITSQELMKLSLPSIGSAIDGAFSEGVWGEKQTFAEMAILLTGKMQDVDTLAIIQELLENTTADGLPIDFDDYFRGRLEILVKLVEVALRANYGSLFTKMGLMEKLKSFTAQWNLQGQAQKMQDDTEA